MTKNEIKKSTAPELINRARLLLEARVKMPAQIALLRDATELIEINTELRSRLIKMLGRDFYPPNMNMGGE